MSGAVCGGDEVGSIVFDIGTHTCKVGFAGEDTPKGVFRTIVGVRTTGGGSDVSSAPSSSSSSSSPTEQDKSSTLQDATRTATTATTATAAAASSSSNSSGSSNATPVPSTAAAPTTEAAAAAAAAKKTEESGSGSGGGGGGGMDTREDADVVAEQTPATATAAAAAAPAAAPAAAAATAPAAAVAKPLTKDYAIGTMRLNFPVSNRVMETPFRKDGRVRDWDLLERIIEYCYAEVLRCDAAERPVMWCESAWTTNEERAKLSALLFDKFNVPAIFFARQSVLSSFAAGKPSALVVDVGGAFSSVVPVYDGYVLSNSVRRSRAAGEAVTSNYRRFLSDAGVNLVPANQVASKQPVGESEPAVWTPRTTYPAVLDPSYSRYLQGQLVEDLKVCVSRFHSLTYDENKLGKIPTTPHEMPNGYNANYGLERYKGPEVVFNPAEFDFGRHIAGGEGAPHPPPSTSIDSSSGLGKLMRESIDACDVDVRSHLWMNIVIVGGTTLIKGFKERIENELQLHVPAGTRFKVVSMTSHERLFGPWIGGSIYASLGSFQQMWVSKAEYKEHGVALLAKRCV